MFILAQRTLFVNIKFKYLKKLDFGVRVYYNNDIMSEKTKMKLWKKLTIICVSVVLGLCLILVGFIGYMRLPVNAYYKASEKVFVIPDTNSGYIAQGLCYESYSKTFILSGYMKDKSASPLYSVNDQGELVKKVPLKTKDGKDFTGHSGGVVTYGNYLYIAGGKCIYAYLLADFTKAKDGDSITCKGQISLKSKTDDNDYISSSFLAVSGNRLITGEFYRAGNYPTPDSHKLTTKAGDYNQALALEFNLNSSYPFGVNPQPVKAYSLPNQVQGLAVHDDKIYLSTSWGLSFSHILEYDKNNLTRQDDITILNTTLPLYALDSDSLLKDYKLPPMSEELVFLNGYMYVNCESASDKYIFGKLTGGKYLYRTDLSKM